MLLCSPLSDVQYLLCRCASLYLHPSRMSSQGLSKLQFCIGHKLPILKLHILKLPVSAPLPSLLLPTHALPRVSHIGGGCLRLAWATVKPYAISKPSTLSDQSNLRYVAHIDKTGLKAYPSDQFVRADVPLPVLSQLVSITVACSIAKNHSISAGSRCNVAQLRSCMEEHKCVDCLLFTTIFAVEDGSIKKNSMRTRK